MQGNSEYNAKKRAESLQRRGANNLQYMNAQTSSNNNRPINRHINQAGNPYSGQNSNQQSFPNNNQNNYNNNNNNNYNNNHGYNYPGNYRRVTNSQNIQNSNPANYQQGFNNSQMQNNPPGFNYNQNPGQINNFEKIKPKKKHRMFLNRRVKHWVEDFFILLIILLNVLDFFKILSEDLDFFKKIISWLCLGYLMYHVNIAKIIFGKESHEDFHSSKWGLKIKDIDFLIIVSFFLLLFKNMTYFAVENYDSAVHSKFILDFLAINFNNLDLVTTQVGGLFILIISIVLAFKYDIRAPSIMAIIHEEGDPPKSKSKLFLRFLSIYLVLNFFFIIVFNFFMEWMAFAVDAPLIVIGILFYLVILLRSKSKFDPESLLFRIGNFGEGFYEKFLELFYTKRGLFLGVTGLLILHLLTDISNFILPYTTGMFDGLYFSNLYDKIHMPLFDFDFTQFPPLSENSLFIQNLESGVSFFSGVIMFFTYIFSIVGAVMLMVAPAFIWYNVYLSKFFSVKRIVLVLFLVSVTILLFNGVFDIDKIHNHDLQKDSPLVGVDIQTQKITKIVQMNIVFFVSILVGIFFYLLSKRQIVKNFLIRVCSAVAIYLFGFYVYLFSSDYISVQKGLVSSSLAQNQYFVSMVMVIFLIAIILFYIGSFILFLIESFYELKNLRE